MVNCLDKAIRLSDANTNIHQQAKELLDGLENLVREQHGTDMGNYIKAQEQFQTGVHLMERREWERAIHAFNATERIVNLTTQVYGNMVLQEQRLIWMWSTVVIPKMLDDWCEL